MKYKDLTEEEKLWWSTLDMNDKYLCKLWSQMFGTAEQRIKQLYIIKDNHNFTIKQKQKNENTKNNNTTISKRTTLV